MSFKTQVEDLIGAVEDDTLISQSLQDIGGEIISVLPNKKLLPVAKTSAITSSGLTVADKKVLAVDKSDVRAKPIPAHEKAKYNDTTSIYAATDTNPVYYIEDEKVYVNGAAGSGATSGHLHYVPLLPTSDGSTLTVHGDSAVVNFPLEAQQLMVLGSAVRCLQRLLADKTSALPTDISGSLTIPSAPVAPVLSSNSVTFTTSAPVYTAPVSSPSFNIVDTFISTDEDIELAGVKIQEINTQIGEYQANIQNQLNVFNDANVEYQAELQKAIQDAQLSQSDDAQILQIYQAEVQNYSAQVNKAIQERNSDIQNFSAKLQKQVTDYQWKQGQYQMLNAEYNQGLQNFIGRVPNQKRN